MPPDSQNISKFYSTAGDDIPILALYAQTVPAGFPSPAADYMEEEIDFNHLLRPRPASTYVIRVQGDSMIEANIPNNAQFLNTNATIKSSIK